MFFEFGVFFVSLSEIGDCGIGFVGDFVVFYGRGVFCLFVLGEDDSFSGFVEWRWGELRGGGEFKGGGEFSEGGEFKSNLEGVGGVFLDLFLSILCLLFDVWDMLFFEVFGFLGFLVIIGKFFLLYFRVMMKDFLDL